MPITIDPNAYYSDEETAKIFGWRLNTLRKNRSQGRGPKYSKYGAATLTHGADIIDELKKNTVRHGAEYKARRLKASTAEAAA